MTSQRIYLASSWRNEHQPELVRILREAGHEVYDFRNPALAPLDRPVLLVGLIAGSGLLLALLCAAGAP